MHNKIKKAFEVIKNPSAYTLEERQKSHNLIERKNRYSPTGESTYREELTVTYREGRPVIHRLISPASGDFEQTLYAEHYFNESGDVEHLCRLLSSDIELTKDTRLFIAGILAGFIKPKNKKKPAYFRDELIYSHIKRLLEQGENLTTTRKDSGSAALQVSERFGITEDSALKIYERKKPKPKVFDPSDYL